MPVRATGTATVTGYATVVSPRGSIRCPNADGPMFRIWIGTSGELAAEGVTVRSRVYRCLVCGCKVPTLEIADAETDKEYIP